MRLSLRGQIVRHEYLWHMNIYIILNGQKIWQEFSSYIVSMEEINIGSEGVTAQP